VRPIRRVGQRSGSGHLFLGQPVYLYERYRDHDTHPFDSVGRRSCASSPTLPTGLSLSATCAVSGPDCGQQHHELHHHGYHTEEAHQPRFRSPSTMCCRTSLTQAARWPIPSPAHRDFDPTNTVARSLRVRRARRSLRPFTQQRLRDHRYARLLSRQQQHTASSDKFCWIRFYVDQYPDQRHRPNIFLRGFAFYAYRGLSDFDPHPHQLRWNDHRRAPLSTLPGDQSSATCVLTGTPTAPVADAAYTFRQPIRCTGTATIHIEVIDVIPAISYAGTPLLSLKTSQSPHNTPSTQAATIVSCSPRSHCPQAQSFRYLRYLWNADRYSRPPRLIRSRLLHRWTQPLRSRSSSMTLSSYRLFGSLFTFTKDVAITSQTPSNSGGTIVSCSPSVALPAASALRHLRDSGTPTAVIRSAPTRFGHQHRCTGTASITIVVNARLHSINYSPTSYRLHLHKDSASRLSPKQHRWHDHWLHDFADASKGLASQAPTAASRALDRRQQRRKLLL